MSSKDPHGDDPSKPSKPRDIRPSNASETSIVRGRRGRGARASGLCNVTGPQCLSCPASANGASVRPPLPGLLCAQRPTRAERCRFPCLCLTHATPYSIFFCSCCSDPSHGMLYLLVELVSAGGRRGLPSAPCGCGPDVVGCEHTTAMQWLADVVSPQARRQGQMHESRNKLAISASHWPQSRQRQGHPRAASGRRAP